MTKLFYIVKRVISVDNKTALIYIKKTLWISGILFLSLYDAWQYMLIIPNELQQPKVAEGIIHQQVLLV